MDSIDNQSVNTRKMREHHFRKLMEEPTSILREETDLVMCSSVIDLSNSEVLNSDKGCASLIEIMKANPENLALVSDLDHQLLIKIYFKDPVTLTYAGFRAEMPIRKERKQEDCTSHDTTGVGNDFIINDCSGPKLIKCYSNGADMDFCDTEYTTPAQEIYLSSDQLNGDKIALRGSRFSRCLSVQFLIEENQLDTSRTFLNRLCLWGRISSLYQVD